jgi:lipoprotein-anchoring transpeptidase ErfK/SrfK
MSVRTLIMIGVAAGIALAYGGSAPAAAQDKAVEVAVLANKGELRSEKAKPRGLFEALFGGTQQMLPETKALDSALDQKKKFKVKKDFEPQIVEFSGYSRGTIVIDPKNKFLYLVEGVNKARRYAIAVGREGLAFSGTATVGDKQEWPRWTPTKEMQQREPVKYGRYKDGMDGGLANPLGARAIYLFQGKRDTHVRIHGTNQPQTIGTASSNGCFRMINDHVIDLYRRVRIGTKVVVL